MGLHHNKKDEEKDFPGSGEAEQPDITTNNEKAPEFDEIGTALNEI